jgi:hypothetical protein
MGASLSSDVVKKIIVGIVAVVVILFGVIKGRELYADYQVKAEAQRLEAEQKKAQEDALKAEEEAKAAAAAVEAAKVAAFAKNARELIGKSSLDLILDQQINERYRVIFSGDNLAAFEKFFSSPAEVKEDGGLVMGAGCNKDACNVNKALAVVDLKTSKVYALAFYNNKVNYFGLSNDEIAALPASVKKWALSVQQ